MVLRILTVALLFFFTSSYRTLVVALTSATTGHVILNPASPQGCLSYHRRCRWGYDAISLRAMKEDGYYSSSNNNCVSELKKHSAIEIWHEKRLHFANFVEKAENKNSMRVQLSNGETCNIDPGQIINIWSRDEAVSSPINPDQWELALKKSTQLLQETPSRQLDLTEFWKFARNQKKNTDKTTSYEVADFLFNCSPRKRKSYQFDPMDCLQPSPAQLAAAALVLASEATKFKRKVGTVVQEASGCLLFEVAGYKALDKSTAATREAISFLEMVEGSIKQKKDDAGAAAGEMTSGGGDSVSDTGGVQGAPQQFQALSMAQLQLVHELELLATSEGGRPSTEARLLLRRYGAAGAGGTPDPKSAKDILIKLGYWSPDNDGSEQRASFAPFPPHSLENAKQLKIQTRNRRFMNSKLQLPGQYGSRTAEGRIDLRGKHKVYCIDSSGTSFLDDALSFDRRSSEILIHIVDVESTISPDILETARMRVQSNYLPGASLFLMPPAALEGLCLSKNYPNECITMFLKLDPDGAIVNYKFDRTLVDPVLPMEYDGANKLLKLTDAEESKDLRFLARYLLANELTKSELTPNDASVGKIRRTQSGEVKVEKFSSTPAHKMVDQALFLYSKCAHRFCETKRVAPPRVAGAGSARGRGARFATAPLRRYLDILAQRQLSNAILGEPGMPKKKIIEEVRWVTWKRNEMVALSKQSKDRALLERLESHCAEVGSAIGWPPVLDATALGGGRDVLLDGFGVRAPVRKKTARKKQTGSGTLNFEKGAKLKVAVVDISSVKGTLTLDEASLIL